MVAIAAAAGFSLISAFAFASVTFALRTLGAGGSARDQAIGCAADTCGSAHAAPVVPEFSLHAASRRPSVTASSRQSHRPTPSPASAAVPEPAPPSRAARPPSSPKVTVGFATDAQWSGGFQGHITITNHGSSAIGAWKVELTLPGDHVSTVWNAAWQMDGGILVLQPASSGQQVAPGGSLSAYFVMNGPKTSPTRCTYDGGACA